MLSAIKESQKPAGPEGTEGSLALNRIPRARHAREIRFNMELPSVPSGPAENRDSAERQANAVRQVSRFTALGGLAAPKTQ